jgi:hypothetical protein
MIPLIRVFLCMLTLFLQPEVDDSSAAETWLRYPVTAFSLGEGGSFEADLTAEPARPVQVVFDEDGRLLRVSRAVSGFLLDRPESPELIRLERIAAGEYSYVSGEAGESGTVVLHLYVEGDLIRGDEHITYVMGDARETFLLTPADAPDPRQDEGQRCAGGARIRLQIGTVAVTSRASGDIDLYASLDSEQPALTVPVGRVRVVAGPLCVDQVAWWQISLVDDSGSVAWTPEMVTTGAYVLNPVHDFEVSAAVACPDALVSRLSIGAFVQVLPEEPAQMLRAAPAEDSRVIASLPAGSFVQVLAGPVCADGSLWWMIGQAGDSGWIAEGIDSRYVLAPSRTVRLSERLRSMASLG